MEKFSDIIKGRLEVHNLDESAKASEVLHISNQLLSDLLKTEGNPVKAYRFDGGTLFIAAENPSWSQEVWGVQEAVLDNLKKHFGKGAIKKIRIKSLTIE